MAINLKTNNKKKACPFLDGEDCLKSGCMMYHEEFARCMIDLLTYNLFSLTAEIKKLNKQQN
jgi:hypothetical protein